MVQKRPAQRTTSRCARQARVRGLRGQFLGRPRGRPLPERVGGPPPEVGPPQKSG